MQAGRSCRYSPDVRAQTKITATNLRSQLRQLASPSNAKFLQRFFKTAPGEYGAGDQFIGIRVPVLRRLAKEFHLLPLREVTLFLRSPIHEERLLALLILVDAFQRGDESRRVAIYKLYLKNLAGVNNWDLVDTSAPLIIGRSSCCRILRP